MCWVPMLLCLFDRPNEGSLRFNVEFSPMASPNFEPGRPTENANELARLIERGLRETKAVDLEALCVLAGRKVMGVIHCQHCFHLHKSSMMTRTSGKFKVAIRPASQLPSLLTCCSMLTSWER